MTRQPSTVLRFVDDTWEDGILQDYPSMATLTSWSGRPRLAERSLSTPYGDYQVQPTPFGLATAPQAERPREATLSEIGYN